MLSSGLKQEDLYALAVKLKKHEWSLEKYGDVGITVLDKAFCGCIYKLATFDDGAAYLVKLMEDKNMDWDAGHSLVLQDAIVRCGKDALPHLQKVRNHPDLAERCIEMINQGAKTAL
ncbi:hypothetical protein Rhal01_03612 [Rubritalea halochordaticola]|uniref:Pentatricopeptide repeat-containing protein n=2 Tax=Rubritalea halochordaticola TaxID=714537 RepID=A0ABP9V418_9BACT